MSAFDPKRTSLFALHMSAYDPKRTYRGVHTRKGLRGACPLEPGGNADDRAVHGHVVFVVGETRTLRVVHEQRLVTEHTAPGDVVADAKIVIKGGKRLP